MYLINVFCFVAWPKPMQIVRELSRNGLVGLGLVPIGPLHGPSPYVPQSGLGTLGALRAHEGGPVSKISTPDLTPCSG